MSGSQTTNSKSARGEITVTTMTAPTMQAAAFEPGGRVVLRQVERPRREPGGVLLRVHACGICGSDLHVLRGGWPPQPHWVGHEIAGEVLEADPDSDLRGGEHVAVEPIVGCGHCRYCEGGAYNHCVQMRFVGGSLPGGYADYLHVPTARSLHRVPPALPWEDAAMAEPLAVGVHALRLADLRAGMRVAIVGGGTIGLLALQAARALSTGPIGVLAKYDHQAALARRLGATATGLSGEENAPARLAAELGGEVDLVVEAVGGQSEAAQQALALVRPLGTVALTGAFSGPVALDLGQVVSKEVRLLGSNCYDAARGQQRDFAIAVDLLATGRVEAGAVITHRFPLRQAPEAFAVALDKGSGVIKAVLLP